MPFIMNQLGYGEHLTLDCLSWRIFTLETHQFLFPKFVLCTVLGIVNHQNLGSFNQSGRHPLVSSNMAVSWEICERNGGFVRWENHRTKRGIVHCHV